MFINIFEIYINIYLKKLGFYFADAHNPMKMIFLFQES